MTSVKRGFWKLTDAGRQIATANPGPLADDVVERLAADKIDVRLRTDGAPVTAPVVSASTPATASPDDRLEGALAELRQIVAAELLETLSQVTPQHFETVVLDLLHRMGYGISREVFATGRWSWRRRD
jgi:restriction system protein